MKTKFTLFTVLIGFAVVALLSSCEKNEDYFQENAFLQKEMGSQEDIELRAAKTYYVASKYKNAYKHLRQNSSECSWTAYTLAAAAVVRGNNKNYPSNLVSPSATDYRNKINHVRDESGSARIDSLASYANRYDKPNYSINVRIQSYDTFDKAVFGFLGERKRGNQKPCIFIGSSNGIGHYFVLWDIDWNGTAATSYVNVTDPLDGSTNSLSSYDDRRTYTNLQTLLNSNIANKYNFLYFD